MTFNFLGPGLTVNVEAKVKEQIILDSSEIFKCNSQDIFCDLFTTTLKETALITKSFLNYFIFPHRQRKHCRQILIRKFDMNITHISYILFKTGCSPRMNTSIFTKKMYNRSRQRSTPEVNKAAGKDCSPADFLCRISELAKFST